MSCPTILHFNYAKLSVGISYLAYIFVYFNFYYYSVVFHIVLLYCIAMQPGAIFSFGINNYSILFYCKRQTYSPVLCFLRRPFVCVWECSGAGPRHTISHGLSRLWASERRRGWRCPDNTRTHRRTRGRAWPCSRLTRLSACAAWRPKLLQDIYFFPSDDRHFFCAEVWSGVCVCVGFVGVRACDDRMSPHTSPGCTFHHPPLRPLHTAWMDRLMSGCTDDLMDGCRTLRWKLWWKWKVCLGERHRQESGVPEIEGVPDSWVAE